MSIPREPSKSIKPYTFKLNVWGGTAGTPVEPPSNAENFGRPTDYYGRDLELSKHKEKIKEEMSKASTQISDDVSSYTSEQLDLVATPYDLKFLSDLNIISVTRRACVEAKATNVAGLGYRVKRVDPKADETDRDDVSDSIKLQLERWSAKGLQSFAELIRSVKFDEESNGNGYIEVSRNRKGRIDGLYHIPSHTIRIKKDRSGFVQILPNGVDRVPFYNFGDKTELKEDGNIEMLPDRDRNINELIHIKLYSHRSHYYGVPEDIAAVPTIMADEAARAYNNKFFKYSATPELMLIFEVDAAAIPTLYGDQPIKVEIDPKTKRDIEEHFRRNLSAATFEPAIFHLPPGVKMRVEKLTSDTKDATFTEFRKNNKAEIREAHRTPGVIVGGADTTYATASVEKAIYLEQVIAPEQERYEQLLMSLFWPELVMIGNKKVAASLDAEGDITINPDIKVAPEDGIGVNPIIWRLDFKEMSVADKNVDAQVHNIYATLGVLTVNEIRMQLGMKPLDDGDKPPAPKEGAEGNATAQNAQAEQAMPPPPDPTGLGKGRGPNGQITPKMPRRAFDQGGFTAANLGSVGTPLSKSEEEPKDQNVVIPRTYLDQLLENQPEAE